VKDVKHQNVILAMGTKVHIMSDPNVTRDGDVYPGRGEGAAIVHHLSVTRCPPQERQDSKAFPRGSLRGGMSYPARTKNSKPARAARRVPDASILGDSLVSPGFVGRKHETERLGFRTAWRLAT
jgi:hypothetical protein